MSVSHHRARKSPHLGSVRLFLITPNFDRLDLGTKSVSFLAGSYEEMAQRHAVDECRPLRAVEYVCSAKWQHHFWWFFHEARDRVLVLVGIVAATTEYIVVYIFHPDHSLEMRLTASILSRFKTSEDIRIRNSVIFFLSDAAGKLEFAALAAVSGASRYPFKWLHPPIYRSWPRISPWPQVQVRYSLLQRMLRIRAALD